MATPVAALPYRSVVSRALDAVRVVVLTLTRRAAVNLGLVRDVVGAAGITASVAGLAGGWWGVLTASVALLVIGDFGGDATTRR